MPPHKAVADLQTWLGSPQLASALATTCVGIAILAWPIHQLAGWPALIATIAVQIALCSVSLWARRNTLDRTGILPLSLLVFLIIATMSLAWSQYQWATLGALAYLAAFSAIGLYVALVRDTIQIVRSYGDVLRLVLALSLGLEMFSGIIIDTPIPVLGITANLASGGPISGILGNRNELGLLALIACISFIIEWRTKIIHWELAIGSLAVATACLFFTRSAIAWGTTLASVLVLGTLYLIRRVEPTKRRVLQFALPVVGVLLIVLAWVFRSAIVAVLNASGELNFRLELWRKTWSLVQLHFLEGWGWIGQWNTGVPPFPLLTAGNNRAAESALNAYLDLWLQLGIVGVAAFVGLLALAFTRSWLLAANRRSVIYTWPAVVLAALITASLAESTVLLEFGWLTLVVCCVTASQNLSWRNALRRPLEQEPLE